MSNIKQLLSLFAVALATHVVQAHKPEKIKFYELKKGNLLVNFTNFGARIVSLNVSDKFGNAADIVLGYDTIDAYKKDKYSLGAILGRVADRMEGDKSTLGKTKYKLNLDDETNTLNGNVIWKVTKYNKSEENPFITFQYNISDDEQGFPGNLNVTATYLLDAKNKLKVTLYAETEDEPISVNLAQHTYWNLGGHNSTGNILHDQLRVLASNYIELDKDLDPTGEILPVRDTPYDFRHLHAIQSSFQELKDGYEVNYLLDQVNNKKKDDVELAAVLHDNKSGRLIKLWTDQPVLQFSTADKLKNVQGKGGVLYQRNAGVLLAAQGYPDSVDIEDSPSQIITKEKPYQQTTVFQFIKK